MIFILLSCALASLSTYPVAGNPLSISDDRSADNSELQRSYPILHVRPSSVNGFINHRIRRESDATKAPEVIKYYDADSLISAITILSENGKPLNPRIRYVNKAFVPDAEGYLVKAPKDQQNTSEKKSEEDDEESSTIYYH